MTRLAWHRVRAVMEKDLLDFWKNRGLVWSMLALPSVLVVVPLGILWTYLHTPDASLRMMAHYYDPTVKPEAAARFMVDKVMTDWLTLYLIMPVFVPMLISSFAVSGEREKRTLEPLLATPLTMAELVAGKSLASLVPAVIVCGVAFLALCAGVDVVVWPMARELVMPNATWLFGVLVLAPLCAFFGNGVAVLISARTGDSRLAQQLSGVFVLPLVGLATGQFGGLLAGGAPMYALVAGVVLLLDLGLVALVPRFFDRERLMSKWG